MNLNVYSETKVGELIKEFIAALLLSVFSKLNVSTSAKFMAVEIIVKYREMKIKNNRTSSDCYVFL